MTQRPQPATRGRHEVLASLVRIVLVLTLSQMFDPSFCKILTRFTDEEHKSGSV